MRSIINAHWELELRIGRWLAWTLVVFGLFNFSYSHQATVETGRWLERGDYPISAETAWRAWRAATRNDGDMRRYLAYARAALGQPHEAFFVRDLPSWKRAWESEEHAGDLDPASPRYFPQAIPDRPLRPWRDYVVEYPPGVFVAIIPPALLANEIDGYHLLFSIYMGLLLTWALYIALRTAQAIAPGIDSRVMIWSIAAVAALGVIAVRRYDAVVSLGLAATFYGLVRGSSACAGGGIGIGIVAKLTPAVLAPHLAVFYLRNKRWSEFFRAALVATSCVALAGMAYLLLAEANVIDMISYHASRPIQIESTAGAVLVLLRAFGVAAVTSSQSFGSENLVSSLDWLLQPATSVLPLAAVAVSWIWAYRNIADTNNVHNAVIAIRAACFTLVSIMVLGKVFSPQYLTWLLPIGVLAAVLAGKMSCVLLISAMALTQLEYPFMYDAGLAASNHPAFAIVVLIRNFVLAVWALALLRSVQPE